MSSPSMSPSDLELCRHALSVFKSDTHKNKNYMFLEPVDTTLIHTYLDIIQKPMDLGTLGAKLENAQYKDRKEFFTEAKLIFQNAQIFHKGKKETAWIIKLAKEMLKLVNREEKAADKKAHKKETIKAPSLKLKMNMPKKEMGEPVPTKPKLNIKLGKTLPEGVVTAAAAVVASAAASASPSAPHPPPPAPKPTALAPKPKKIKLSILKPTPKPSSTTNTVPPAEPPRAPSRGKELPKGVVAPTKKKTPKKKLAVLSEDRKAQCFKVLAGLKRNQPQHVLWFLKPISDKQVVDDYRAKIPSPMDMGTMASKLEKGDYTSVTAFCLDLRRTFGNCLRFNTSVHDGFRPVAIEMQATSEELLAYFLKDSPFPRLLYCWKLCVSVLDALLNLNNATDGHQTAHYFLHPVSFYCGGNFPPDYLQKIQKPMDLGTVTSNLMEGHYTTVMSFCADCRLILENCITYYSGREDGQLFVDQARRLKELMSQQLDALQRYDQSSNGARAAALASTAVPKPPKKPRKDLLLNILKDLRNLVYTDKFTKISEPATRAFETPVDLVQYPDYIQFAKTPMDLQTVETRVRSDFYNTLEDFEYDVALIFRNCEAYSAPRRNDHLVSISRYCAKHFRKIIANRLRPVEPVEPKRQASPTAAQQGPSKKMRVEPTISTGKTVPRISIPSAALAASKTLEKNRIKSPKPQQKKKEEPKSDQPVPLHVAIAQVKERFPLRRPYKYLEPWEAACARSFRELMRHPWISAARPKFIFHVPVPVLFPDLQEVYTAKIRKPMDLTTVEAKLLQGGIYRGPQDMVDDIALVFSNAISFNREGKDAGDLLSCAYYDASVHLLRYIRWLSLELLTPYFSDDGPAESAQEGEGTLTSWKLTASNKKSARTEMESLVLKEILDKSIEGDRYTWMETECEKLLKALRHQSDLRHMTFFLTPNYPADYAAFISKPMDWDRVNRRLQRREYETIGDVVGDLRLIFSNALKYNARAKGTETVSGIAYEAAIYMSIKLELAIDKMMLSVSDRLERERIEHAIAEREIYAAERAEDERMRAQWTGSSSAKPSESVVVTTETGASIISRRPQQQKEMRDFEFPYFDDEEDEGRHEQSYIDYMRQQKLTFEKQRNERKVMKANATKVGAAVFARLQQRTAAIAWAREIAEESSWKGNFLSANQEQSQGAAASSAFAELNRSDRTQIKMQVTKKPKAKKRKNDLLHP